MRNRWGVEIKKGHHVFASWGRNGDERIEGKVVSVDSRSDFARAYGSQVTLENGITIAADSISQTLGPMKVGRGGVVTQNPAEARPTDDNPPNCYLSRSKGFWRVIYQGMPICNDKRTLEEALGAAKQARVSLSKWTWDGDAGKWVSQNFVYDNPLTRIDPRKVFTTPSQATGHATPSRRLAKRRKATAKLGIPGAYANPLTRVEINSRSQRDHFNEQTGGYSNRPTKRLKARRAATEDLPAGFYANPRGLKMTPHYGDANQEFWFVVSAKAPSAKKFKRIATFAIKELATVYARAYHNAHPGYSIKVDDER